jgi:hypothetical protein
MDMINWVSAFQDLQELTPVRLQCLCADMYALGRLAGYSGRAGVVVAYVQDTGTVAYLSYRTLLSLL